MEILFQYIGGAVVIAVATWFMYMSVHVTEENKRGKYLALPWEDFSAWKKWFNSTGKSDD